MKSAKMPRIPSPERPSEANPSGRVQPSLNRLRVFLVYVLTGPGLTGLVLFSAAGRLDIPFFWAYLALYLAVGVLSVVLLDPGLLQERIKPGGKPIPRRYYLATFIFFVHFAVAGFDVGRWHLSQVSWQAQLFSLAVLALVFALALWAMRVNPFFSPLVRLQSERGHHVISHGPYAIVRHPGYAVGLLFLFASGPALGSGLATIPLLPMLPGLFIRLSHEERFLMANLPGYADYAARVRYRLVPFVW